MRSVVRGSLFAAFIGVINVGSGIAIPARGDVVTDDWSRCTYRSAPARADA